MASNKVADNITNFKKITRQDFPYRKVNERISDYKDIYKEYTADFIKSQASRCMDCGIPFCMGYGCPVMNQIPDFNEKVFKGLWEDAYNILIKTSHFPEVTGSICPAPCEDACTLNVGMDSVTIKNVELAIIEKAFELDIVKPILPKTRTGKKVAIIGSGPAGLYAARELNIAGHTATVFEKDEKIGGFLRYGIPDFKLEKRILDRRLQILESEGIEFKTNINAGVDISFQEIRKTYDAVMIAIGARQPRDLPIEGRELKGIHFATDYLFQSNRKVDEVKFKDEELIDAKGKHVLVIGGGDTGSDCIGTARRQGALSVTQVEILPKPPLVRSVETPWPAYAKKLRTSSSQEEGCERKWCIQSKKFIGENGRVKKVEAFEIKWGNKNGKLDFSEIPGSNFDIHTELVLLAMGFVHPEKSGLITDSKIELDAKGNIKTSQFGYGETSIEGVFAAGDASRGASLVVWAFAHARDCCKLIKEYLR